MAERNESNVEIRLSIIRVNRKTHLIDKYIKILDNESFR